MDFVVPLLIFAILGPVVIITACRTVPEGERGWLLKVLLVALFLRVGVATILEAVPGARVFHDDANNYESVGVRLALSWRGKYPPIPLSPLNSGYHYLCGIICYIFGPYAFNIPLFNSVVGTLAALLSYKLARQFFPIIVARFAAGLVAFTPSMILWSGIALKDAPMAMLILIALSSCVSLKRKVRFWPVMGIVLSIAAMQMIRFYMVYFVGFAVVATMAFDRGTKIVTGIYKQVAIVAIVVIFLGLMGLQAGAIQGAEYFELRKVSAFRKGMAISARSAFATDVDISTPDKAFAFLPVGMATLLLAPFPWQVVSLGPALAAPETIAWWFFIPSTLRGLRFVLRRRFAEISPIVLFMFTLTCGYSLTHGNVGSAFRQRAQIFVLFFMFTAVGWYVKKARAAGIDEELLLRKE